MYPTNQHLHPVAGFSGGKKVYATQEAFAVLRELRIAATQKQNFWATTVIRGVDSLTSGPMKKNVFINPKQIRGSDENFTVFFPGASMQVARNSRDEYCVVSVQTSAEVDNLEEYEKLYKAGNLPGLYNAIKERGSWTTTPKPTATPQAKELVAIADRTYKRPEIAAKEASQNIGSAPEVTSADLKSTTGFNLHYTPSDPRLGGLQRYLRAKTTATAKDASFKQSAQVLAQTMYNSRGTEGVRWVSEYGGSAVMVEALKMVADWGGTLNNHYLFLQYPTSSQTDIARQADRVGLNYGRELGKSGVFNYRPMDQAALAVYRSRSNSTSNKEIKGLKAALDVAKPVGATAGAVGALTGLAALAGVGIGTAAVSPALVAIGGTIAKAAGALGLAKQSTELLGRRAHHAIQRSL